MQPHNFASSVILVFVSAFKIITSPQEEDNRRPDWTRTSGGAITVHDKLISPAQSMVKDKLHPILFSISTWTISPPTSPHSRTIQPETLSLLYDTEKLINPTSHMTTQVLLCYHPITKSHLLDKSAPHPSWSKKSVQ